MLSSTFITRPKVLSFLFSVPLQTVLPNRARLYKDVILLRLVRAVRGVERWMAFVEQFFFSWKKRETHFLGTCKGYYYIAFGWETKTDWLTVSVIGIFSISFDSLSLSFFFLLSFSFFFQVKCREFHRISQCHWSSFSCQSQCATDSSGSMLCDSCNNFYTHKKMKFFAFLCVYVSVCHCRNNVDTFKLYRIPLSKTSTFSRNEVESIETGETGAK